MKLSMSVSVLCLLVGTASNASGQPGEGLQQPLPIPVSLAPTISGDGIPGLVVPWVEDGVRAAMPAAGFASLSASPLLLQLRINTRSLGTSDAGMRAITLAEVAVTIELRDPAGRGAVASSRITREGNGRDLAAATSQALSQVANNQAGIRAALEELGAQAARAFESACDDVLASAMRLAKERDFDAAIGLTMGVPTGAPRCRARAQALAQTLYTQRVQWQCGSALQQGRAARAAGDFESALDALRYVDPLSPCSRQVTELIEGIGTDARAKSAREAAERAQALRMEWGLRRESIQAIAGIERQRLAVIGMIAEAALTRRR